MPRTGYAHAHHRVQGDKQNADFSVCYCYCLTEYTTQLGGQRLLRGRGRRVAIQVHQLVEKFCETKTIQYNSNDNCYVFCYKNQIETRQATERGEGEVGQVSASSGVDEKLCTPYAACLRPRKCLLNRFILAKNTSSSETCNVSIHFKHTILIEGERAEDATTISVLLFFLSFYLSRFATLGFFAIPTQISQPQRALNGDACNINNAGQQKQQQTGKGMKIPEKNTVTHKAHIDTLNTL